MLKRIIILAISFYASIVFAHRAVDVQIKHLNKQLKATPENGALFLKRGELHRQHGEWQLALRDFQQAKKTNSTSGDTDFYIGRLRLDINQADKALPLLSRFVRLNPNHSNALQNQGDAHFSLENFTRAAHVYKQVAALEQHPDPELFLKIARAYTAAGSGYQKQAKEAIEEGILRLGPLVTIVMVGIELELNQEDYKAALVLLEKLPKVVRDSPKWLGRRGDILNSSGRKEEAILTINRAIFKVENLPISRRNTREMTKLIGTLKSNLKSAHASTLKGN